MTRGRMRGTGEENERERSELVHDEGLRSAQRYTNL